MLLMWVVDAKKKLMSELQEYKITSTTSLAKHSELQEAVKAYRSKAENYLTRLEQAEIERAKAANAEAFSESIIFFASHRSLQITSSSEGFR